MPGADVADVIEIEGPLDICRAQRRVRTLAERAGLASGAVFQMLIAVSELSNHLFLSARRKGRLRLSRARRGARRGFEVVAEVETGGHWALGLPSIERLVDELDAGFGPDGRILVTARSWAREARHLPEVLGAGPIAALAKS